MWAPRTHRKGGALSPQAAPKPRRGYLPNRFLEPFNLPFEGSMRAPKPSGLSRRFRTGSRMTPASLSRMAVVAGSTSLPHRCSDAKADALCRSSRVTHAKRQIQGLRSLLGIDETR